MNAVWFCIKTQCTCILSYPNSIHLLLYIIWLTVKEFSTFVKNWDFDVFILNGVEGVLVCESVYLLTVFDTSKHKYLTFLRVSLFLRFQGPHCTNFFFFYQHYTYNVFMCTFGSFGRLFLVCMPCSRNMLVLFQLIDNIPSIFKWLIAPFKYVVCSVLHICHRRH